MIYQNVINKITYGVTFKTKQCKLFTYKGFAILGSGPQEVLMDIYLTAIACHEINMTCIENEMNAFILVELL